MLMTAEHKTEVCELSSFGLICFTGPDARAFLQGQLTCDVEALTPDMSTYGSYCTPKGRVLMTFLLWRAGDDYVMQLPRALREAVQKRLLTYVLRSKVRVADATGDWVLLGLSGKTAATFVRMVCGKDPAEIHSVVHSNGATAIRLPGERYELVITSAQAPAIKTMLSRAMPIGSS